MVFMTVKDCAGAVDGTNNLINSSAAIAKYFENLMGPMVKG
jgi:hypothetical protein